MERLAQRLAAHVGVVEVGRGEEQQRAAMVAPGQLMGPQRLETLRGASGDPVGLLGVRGGVVQLDVGGREPAHVVMGEGRGHVLFEARADGGAGGQRRQDEHEAHDATTFSPPSPGVPRVSL